MRRLPHILLNAATAASLVLCVATVALWVRSYRQADQFAWKSDAARRAFRSERGAVNWDNYAIPPDYARYARREAHKVDWDIGYRWSAVDDAQWPSAAKRYPQRTDLSPTSSWCGVAWTRGVWSFVYPGDAPDIAPRGAAWYALRVPHALLAGLLALPPGYALASGAAARVRRWANERAALCPACGYDLRATPDRWPECGTIPAR